VALNIQGILDAVISHAAASGHFEAVNGHEPANAPGHGLTCAVWADQVAPVRSSGLASLSVRLIFNVRIYTSAIQEPPDAIDPNLVAAVDTLCAAYAGDFTLGGLVREVDLLGQHGQPIEVRAGYIQQDGQLYRVATISLAVVVNDLWTEAA
jgi:hypothetical protein